MGVHGLVKVEGVESSDIELVMRSIHELQTTEPATAVRVQAHTGLKISVVRKIFKELLASGNQLIKHSGVAHGEPRAHKLTGTQWAIRCPLHSGAAEGLPKGYRSVLWCDPAWLQSKIDNDFRRRR